MTYPKHVAVIPDGNRTRAKENNKSVEEAYLISYERGIELIEYTFTQTDIQVFTLRGLSTENTNKRPPEEFDFLMNMHKMVDDWLEKILLDNNINFKRIGNPNGITQEFQDYLNEKTKKCKSNSDKYFIFAVNYGWRDEIVRAVQSLAKEQKDCTNITEQDISNASELTNVPPIELVIRTKGDQAHRTSGFMSRRIGYAELYFTQTKCPVFDTTEYKKALEWFTQVEDNRNFGK